VRTVLRAYRDETDADAVTALLTAYLTWAFGRLADEHGVDDGFMVVSGVRESLGHFGKPGSMMVVAELDGAIAGVAALRTLEPGVAEIKRMYVNPSARGHGLGSALLDYLLAYARQTLHATTMRLDTADFLTDARRLYVSRGFAERDSYEGSEIPLHLQRYWRFYELTLGEALS
jgi:GNAT superfamily N-acetyltransferase